MKKYNITAICALVSSFLIGSSCLAMNNQPYNSISPLSRDHKKGWIWDGIYTDDYVKVWNVISNHAGYGTDGNLYYVCNQLSSTSLIYIDYRILRNQALSHILDEKTLLNENSLKILQELTMREVTSIQPGSQKSLIGTSLVDEVYKAIQSCQSQDKVKKVLSAILNSFSNTGDRMIFIQNLLLNKAKENNDQKTIENLFFAIEESLEKFSIEAGSISRYNEIKFNFIDYKKPWFKPIVEAYVNSTLKSIYPERPYFFLTTYFPSILSPQNYEKFLIDTISSNNSHALFLVGERTPVNILCFAIENFRKNYTPKVAHKILPEEILKCYVSGVEITSMQELSYIKGYLLLMGKYSETYNKALDIIRENNPTLHSQLWDLWLS